jgi:hypothetical protein
MPDADSSLDENDHQHTLLQHYDRVKYYIAGELETETTESKNLLVALLEIRAYKACSIIWDNLYFFCQYK